MTQVVVVDHANDSGLCTIDSLAADAVSNAIKFGAEACVFVSTSCLTQIAHSFFEQECFQFGGNPCNRKTSLQQKNT